MKIRKEYLIFGGVILFIVVLLLIAKFTRSDVRYDKDKIAISYEDIITTEEVNDEYNDTEQESIDLDDNTSDNVVVDTVDEKPVVDEQSTEEQVEDSKTSGVDSTELEDDNNVDGFEETDRSVSDDFSSLTDTELSTLIYGYTMHTLDPSYIAFLSEDCLSVYNSDSQDFSEIRSNFFSFSLDRDNTCLHLTSEDGTKQYDIYYTVSDNYLTSVYMNQ